MSDRPQNPINSRRYTMDDIKDNAGIKQGYPGINEYYERKLQAFQNRRHRRNPGL
jgi:hypothetical protein